MKVTSHSTNITKKQQEIASFKLQTKHSQKIFFNSVSNGLNYTIEKMANKQHNEEHLKGIQIVMIGKMTLNQKIVYKTHYISTDFNSNYLSENDLFISG